MSWRLLLVAVACLVGCSSPPAPRVGYAQLVVPVRKQPPSVRSLVARINAGLAKGQAQATDLHQQPTDVVIAFEGLHPVATGAVLAAVDAAELARGDDWTLIYYRDAAASADGVAYDATLAAAPTSRQLFEAAAVMLAPPDEDDENALIARPGAVRYQHLPQRIQVIFAKERQVDRRRIEAILAARGLVVRESTVTLPE